MIPYYPPHDDPSRQSIFIPPHLFPGPPVGGFVFPGSGHPPVQPFPPSYPLHPPQFLPQFPPAMHQQYPYPRQSPPSFLADPAFSPDPRSNPHFFSMNDREEIYPASLSGSLSDYASTVPDDESEVDHTNLPPRMRHLAGPDVVIPPRHARSQSAPYLPPPPPPLPQNLSRSTSARVIPVPPPNPIYAPSPPAPSRQRSSRDDLPENPSRPSPVHPSASAAAQIYWQPPPPYSDSESDSSSSNPHTPSSSPPSSARHHLPREAKGPTIPTPSFPEKRSVPEAQPISSTSSSSAHAVPQSRNDAPAPATKASSINPPVVRPKISPHNASAPELYSPPAPLDVPLRPSTVPIPAAPPETPSAPLTSRRRNSKNPSISTPPRDLDSIDELDESDPLGFAWHHDGPYEAIAKATGSARNPGASAHKPSKPKRKPVQAYDSVSVGVAPGQIFPSFSQYQPQAVGNGVQVDVTVLPEMPPAENFQVLSPPRSPLALPIQRRVPPTGQPPATPDQYSNMHMNLAMDPAPTMASFSVPVSEMRDSRMPRTQIQQPSPERQRTPERRPSQTPSPPTYDDGPPPSPSLPNPYSPSGPTFPSVGPSRQNSGSRPVSTIHPRPDLPPSNVVPRPDIDLPPQRQQDKATSLLPRHLPKRLVMPAPLQQNQNQNLQQGQAHVEFLAQRHGPPPMASVPGASASAASQHQQQVRAADIPFGHGPKLLRKKHTSGAPQPEPPSSSSAPLPSAMTSSGTAATFSAKVRFAEPPREETKEERKKREKEEARREKEEARREKARAKSGARPEIPLQGIFAVDYIKEAELARQREFAKMDGAKTGRKLSKRR